LLLSFLLLALLHALPTASGQDLDFVPQQQQNKEEFLPSGLQTGPDTSGGSSVATAALYRPETSSVVVVGTTLDAPTGTTTSANGSTGGSGCFFGTVPVASSSSRSDTNNFAQQQTLDVTDVQEECSNAKLIGDRLIAAGHADKRGGVLDPLFVDGGYQEIEQVGMLIDMSLDSQNTLSFVGGHLLQQSLRSYPVEMAVHRGANAAAGDNDLDESTNVYVASMETSIEMYISETQQQWQRDELTILNDPTKFFLYGGLFFNMVITQTRFQQDSSHEGDGLQESLAETWRVPYSTTNGQSVYVAGLEIIGNNDDVLVAAGTTAGSGPAFGGAEDGNSENDLDGFVSLLSPQNGRLLSSDTPSSVRIGSTDGQDDWLAATCASPQDKTAVYVVGSTLGRMSEAIPVDGKHPESVHAYLIKLSLVGDSPETYDLEVSWGRQLGATENGVAPTIVKGTACTVTHDGQYVYYGGVAENGAVLEMAGTTESYGGDDIFVEKVWAETGESVFVRQLGSDADDSLALRGGLTTDVDGNLIVIGNTYGSLYRTRGASENKGDATVSDVFVATISGYNGAAAQPVTHPEYGNTSSNNEQDGGKTFEGEDNDSDSTKNNNGSDNGGAAQVDPPPVAPPATKEQPSQSNPRFGVAVFFLLAFFVSLTVYCLFFSKWSKGRFRPAHEETDRSRVLSYLSDFEVEDVDLRHSATGGWHCSYAGPLAHGVNPKQSRRGLLNNTTGRGLSSSSPSQYRHHDPLTAPLTGVEILEDSLYASPFVVDANDSYDEDDGSSYDERRRSRHQPSSSSSGGLDSHYSSNNNDRSSNSNGPVEQCVTGLLGNDDNDPILRRSRQQRGTWGSGVV